MLLTDAKSREREVISKGIDRLEKQILQYIGVYISKDQEDIGHIKMCKFTDILALNTAMGNIQKSLQRYVGFYGLAPDYCDEIENLMNSAQVWAMDIEKSYNKAEIHSINTSNRGRYQDVKVFYNNSTVTIFEFLEICLLLNHHCSFTETGETFEK